jgi:SNF2 family DNA or RNA helicase
MLAMFSPDATVRLKHHPDQIGTVSGPPKTMAGLVWYRVKFADGRVESHPEQDLESFSPVRDVETLLLAKSFAGRESLTRLITITKIQRPLSNNVYSFQASRTKFYPHQLKPVLKYLDSTKRRLLIADEVGLGKTIEAGLILVEERARQDLARVLVVCPSALRQKWQQEMKTRFDEEFDILNADGVRDFLRRFESDGEAVKLRGIVSLQTIRNAELLAELDALQPHLDLVFIDEAHHLRNTDTYSHAAGRSLSACADSMVMLTATPVHLGNENLFALLKLLDPEEFDEIGAFRQRLDANRHVVRAQRLLGRFPADLAEVSDELRKIEGTLAGHRLASNPAYQDTLRHLATHSGDSHSDVIALQRQLAGLNLLGHIFTRSRKVDVHEKRPVRTPRVVKSPFLPDESHCYDDIVGFAGRWYERRAGNQSLQEVEQVTLDWLRENADSNVDSRRVARDIYANSFAALMLQRQAASSLPALIEQALAVRAHEVSAADADDPEGEVPEPLQARAQSIKQDPEFRALISQYKGLEATDSKYAALVGALDTLDEEENGSKAIVFSFFKSTLRYLHRRLLADGHKCVVVHGDILSTPGRPETDERGRAFAKFEEDPSMRILLCSEVGSEGLDMQFCHIMFNYDLPWNPMVVEQRIGRLDRFGQESDRILICNFATPGTIEDRILTRLYERIKIFEESIGDLEPILGEEIQQLHRDLLKMRLTPAEQTRRTEELAAVIELKRQEIQDLETTSDQLVGHDEYFREELGRVQSLGRFITSSETTLLVREFLHERFPKSDLRETATDAELELVVDEALIGFVRRHCDNGDPLLHTFLAKAYRGTLRVTCQNELAFKDRSIEFLATHHPLIKAIAAFYRTEAVAIHPVSAVTVASDTVPPGWYLFLLYVLRVTGARQVLQFEPVFVSRDSKVDIDPIAGEQLLGDITRRGESFRLPPDIRVEELRPLLERGQDMFGARLTGMLSELRLSNDALAASRQATVEASYAVKLQRQRERLQTRGGKAHEPRYVRMIDGSIRRLEVELDAKRRTINESRRVSPSFELIAGGVVNVMSTSAKSWGLS